jgi:pimeloyl-ACP methyl ester carboxylesterase
MKKVAYLAFARTIGFYLNVMSFVFPKKAILKAYTLFSIPRIGKLSKEALPKILKEAVLETLIANDQSIQTYLWKGDETIILLIHGWESNSSRWAKLIIELKKTGHSIVAIDAPAHGLSSGKIFSVPNYAEYIKIATQKYQPKFIIGHSMGGKACLYYQYLYQNLDIKKMILLGTPCDFNIIIENYIKLLYLNSIVSRGLKKHYLDIFNIDIEQFSGRLFASKINIESLIFHDIEDKIVLFEEGKKLAKYLQNSTFIETKGLGHGLQNKALYRQIKEFIVAVN